MTRLLLTSLSNSMNNIIRRRSLVMEFCRFKSSTITSSFDDNKEYDAKGRLLSLLTELRDKDIAKLDTRLTSLLNIAKQSVPLNKLNTSFKNIQTLLPNHITTLKYDIDQLIITLKSIPLENFDSNKIHQFLLMNEKIDRQHIDAMIINNVFKDLCHVIDDLWIGKRAKLKLQSIIVDLKLVLVRLEEENIELKESVSYIHEENIQLKESVLHLHQENTYHKYQSCVSELILQIVRSIKKEFRKKLKMEYLSENFDQAAFESLLNNDEHEDIKEDLNLDDHQINVILTIFDKICNKYGFGNKNVLFHYLLLVSNRNEREHDMMNSYIKLCPDDQLSFKNYCEKNNLMGHYKHEDQILLEGLFRLYAGDLMRKLKKNGEGPTEPTT